MKKSTLFTAAVTGLFVVSLGFAAFAQNFAPPIPIGSDKDQVVVSPNTKTMATHLKFFKHPRKPVADPSASQNFAEKKAGGFDVMVGEKGIDVDDIAATPGLLNSVNRRPAGPESQMVDSVGARALNTLEPLHFFCPEKTKIEETEMGLDCRLSTPPLYKTSPTLPGDQPCSTDADCDAWYSVSNCYTCLKITIEGMELPGLCKPIDDVCGGGKGNVTSHQLEIADVRNTMSSSDTDFIENVLGNPLVAAVIGSAQENVPPYVPNTYPALVMKDMPFKWKWNLPDPGYTDAIAYGLADLSVVDKGVVTNNGIVTAIYDPISVELVHQVFIGGGMTPVKYVSNSVVQKIMDELLANPFQHCPTTGNCDIGTTFISPLAFFRADDVTGRMLLSGYSSLLQIPKNSLDNFISLPEAIKNPGMFLFYMFSQNFNPVSVTAMKFGKDVVMGLSSTIEVERKDGFAVLNQATTIDLDGQVVAGGKIVLGSNWQDTLKLGTQPLNSTLMPNRVPSYVTFWNRQEGPWGHTGMGDEKFDNPNPNYVYGPFKVALVGSDAFSSAELKDNPDGKTEKSYLLVPAGDPGHDGRHYVYKINPTDDPALQAVDPLTGRSIPTPIVLPSIFPIEVPSGGFAPYNVVTAEIDGNAACGDMALTFRGQETIYAGSDPDFKNTSGQTVVFSNTKVPSSVFSDKVHVHFGKLDGAKCVFNETPDVVLTMPKDLITQPQPQPLAQVAGIAVADFDLDGNPDLLAGDLIPRQIVTCDPNNAAECLERGLYTGFAYLFNDVANFLPGQAPMMVRTGKATSKTATADLVLAMQDKTGAGGLVGPGALDVNVKPGQTPAIAAINGAPLMLPPFGCPDDSVKDPTGVQVVSVPELIHARLTGFPGTTWHPLKPQRCYEDVEEALDVMCKSSGAEFLDEDHPCCGGCSEGCRDVCTVFVTGTGYDFDAMKTLLADMQKNDPKMYNLCSDLYHHLDSSGGVAGGGLCIGTKNDTDDGQESAFACLFRPDEVVTSPRDGIISFAALKNTAFDPVIFPGGIEIPDNDRIKPPIGGFIDFGVNLDFIADPDARYPRGQVMGGPREMTAILTADPSIEPPDPPPPPQPMEGDAFLRCLGDMSVGVYEARMKIEKDFLSGVVGRPDQIACGFGMPVEVYVHTPGGASGDMILPSATVQNGGKLFMRFPDDMRNYSHVNVPAGKSVQLLPAPGGMLAMTAKGVSVDLSSFVSDAVPMASVSDASEVSYEVGGKNSAVSFNGVFSAKQYLSDANTQLSLGSGPGALNLAVDSPGVVTQFNFILPPGCGWGDGNEKCLEGVEPGVADLEAVRAELLSRSQRDSSVFYGLPWGAKAYNMQFSHVQAKEDGTPKEHKFAVLMMNFAQATGGGCGCVMGGFPPTLPGGLLILFSVAAVFAGVRWRVRK